MTQSVQEAARDAGAKPPPGAATVGAMRAVTLRLEDELFAIEAESVREILDLTPITRVPNASAFVGGLINVRGAVVPLADFRVMFGMERRPCSQDTRIVVIEVKIEGESLVAGLLADKVHDVTEIQSASVEPAPTVGMRWPSRFIRGIGQHGPEFIVIPDMARIFAEQGGVSSASQSEERPE